MTTNLTLEMANVVGELGRLGTVLGAADVNIQGLCAVSHGGTSGLVHLLVEDPEPAYKALDLAGITIDSDDEVLVVEVLDRPGALGEVARKLGEAGVNINVIYLATSTRLVIGADELNKARLVLE